MLHITDEELKKALISSGFIDEKQFQKALEESKKADQDISNVLIEHGDVSEEYLAEILAQYFGVEFVHIKKQKISEDVIKIIPEHLAKAKKVIAFTKDKNNL